MHLLSLVNDILVKRLHGAKKFENHWIWWTVTVSGSDSWFPPVLFLHLLRCCGTAFSALTLLVGRQEGHLACKNWLIRCWRGYLPGARCRWFAYGPADATATPSSVASLKPGYRQPFWCRLIQVVLEKRPLNRCRVPEENLWDNHNRFFQAECPSCHSATVRITCIFIR